jgi:release factor glutamine methyltransferase
MNSEKKETKKMRLEDISFPAPRNGYSPAEDSWLLVHAIEKNKKSIHEKKCLDMGCGNGIQSAALLLNGARDVTCVDVNEDALTQTRKMIEKYFSKKEKVNYVSSFLFDTLNKEKFDAIVFNPPYVPSETIKWVEVDGGKKGREIIDLFLDQLPAHLTPNGVCFLLQTSLNSHYLTRKKCAEKGLRVRIIAKQKLSFEELHVLKITL